MKLFEREISAALEKQGETSIGVSVVARMLRCRVHTVRRLIESGTLNAYRLHT